MSEKAKKWVVTLFAVAVLIWAAIAAIYIYNVNFIPKNTSLPKETTAELSLASDKGLIFESQALTSAHTFDAGSLRPISSIRYLPSRESADAADACIGTRIYASADNKNFVELLCIEADSGGSVTQDWHEVFFSGYGLYRYFKIDLPKGSTLDGIEFIEESGINCGKNFSAELSAFDISREFDGQFVLASYSSNGLLTKISASKAHFAPGSVTSASLMLGGISVNIGEYVRAFVTDDRGQIVSQPLIFKNTAASQTLSLPNYFGNNMLLQANENASVWGKAPRGTAVTAVLKDESGQTSAYGTAMPDENSSWQIELGSHAYGGSYTLDVTAGESSVKYTNITFGDVWLFIGQSNMEMFMETGADTRDYLNSREGKREADNSNLRILNLADKGVKGTKAAPDNLPTDSWSDAWYPMNADYAKYCSAVAYMFSQKINHTYNVPVGILNFAVTDTEINMWTPSGTRRGSYTCTGGELYNNRLSPIKGLKIRGILMYQGEADYYRTFMKSNEYSDAMSAMVDHCRTVWGDDLPFYWAQLARYAEKDYTEVRYGQFEAFNKINNTKNAGIVSLLDVYGDFDAGMGSARGDIHPFDKKRVADRFFEYAARDVYGNDNAQPDAPRYKSMKIEGSTIRLTFECIGTLRTMPKEQYADKLTDSYISENELSADSLQEFWIAGSDGNYVRAEATINGNEVTVWSDAVPEPKSVKYACGAYPEMPNLTDSTGLPAYAFEAK